MLVRQFVAKLPKRDIIMSLDPLFVASVSVAKGRDVALVSIGAPAGAVADDRVQNVEILRLVMTYETMAQAAAALTKAVKEIDASRKNQGSAFGVRRTFVEPDDLAPSGEACSDDGTKPTTH